MCVPRQRRSSRPRSSPGHTHAPSSAAAPRPLSRRVSVRLLDYARRAQDAYGKKHRGLPGERAPRVRAVAWEDVPRRKAGRDPDSKVPREAGLSPHITRCSPSWPRVQIPRASVRAIFHLPGVPPAGPSERILPPNRHSNE